MSRFRDRSFSRHALGFTFENAKTAEVFYADEINLAAGGAFAAAVKSAVT